MRTLRVPCTIIGGGLVGVALGLGGHADQGNHPQPVADPGILGVEAGASLFVVIGILLRRRRSRIRWFVPGAAVSLGGRVRAWSMGRDGSTPSSSHWPAPR